jgi:hypothetical protein
MPQQLKMLFSLIRNLLRTWPKYQSKLPLALRDPSRLSKRLLRRRVHHYQVQSMKVKSLSRRKVKVCQSPRLLQV